MRLSSNATSPEQDDLEWEGSVTLSEIDRFFDSHSPAAEQIPTTTCPQVAEPAPAVFPGPNDQWSAPPTAPMNMGQFDPTAPNSFSVPDTMNLFDMPESNQLDYHPSTSQPGFDPSIMTQEFNTSTNQLDYHPPTSQPGFDPSIMTQEFNTSTNQQDFWPSTNQPNLILPANPSNIFLPANQPNLLLPANQPNFLPPTNQPNLLLPVNQPNFCPRTNQPNLLLPANQPNFTPLANQSMIHPLVNQAPFRQTATGYQMNTTGAENQHAQTLSLQRDFAANNIAPSMPTPEQSPGEFGLESNPPEVDSTGGNKVPIPRMATNATKTSTVSSPSGPRSRPVTLPPRPKPGRKPMAPDQQVDRRRQQNRQAQRAFRDKRQHKLQDLNRSTEELRLSYNLQTGKLLQELEATRAAHRGELQAMRIAHQNELDATGTAFRAAQEKIATLQAIIRNFEQKFGRR